MALTPDVRIANVFHSVARNREEAVAHDQFHLDALINEIPWRQETYKLYGKQGPIPRLTAWFGDVAYRWSGVTQAPQALTHPSMLFALREAEAFAGVTFNACLANYYRNGLDSVSWHADNEVGVGPIVASVSFGGACTFQMRRVENPSATWETKLGAGDLLVMGEGVQHEWVHQIPKRAKVIAPRVNLTFRMMEPVGKTTSRKL